MCSLLQVSFEFVVDLFAWVDGWHVRWLIGDVQTIRHFSQRVGYNDSFVNRRIVHQKIERCVCSQVAFVCDSKHCWCNSVCQKLTKVVATRCTSSFDQRFVCNDAACNANSNDDRVIVTFARIVFCDVRRFSSLRQTVFTQQCVFVVLQPLISDLLYALHTSLKIRSKITSFFNHKHVFLFAVYQRTIFFFVFHK